MIPWLMIAALLHPVHATLSEVEWNETTKRLEFAIRLDSLDEQWLTKQYGKDRKVSDWAIQYVSRRVRVTELPKPEDRDDRHYHWIGRQQDGAHVWWYFEIETPDAKAPTWIEQRVLFEREDNYTNRVLILNADPKRSLSLTKKQPRGSLVE